MSTINDGGPANEMSLRAYFAAHAPITFADALSHVKGEINAESVMDWLSTARKIYADAMIAALERKA